MNVARDLALTTDNPRGNALIEAERAADGQHPLTYLDGVGIAQTGGDQPGRRILQADHGHIGLRIGAHYLGGELASVGEGHRDFAGLFRHVAVGHDVSGTVDHHPRASAMPGPRRGQAFKAVAEVEEVLKEALHVRWQVVALEAAAGKLGLLDLHIDAHHAGPQGPGRGREGLRQRTRLLRDLGLGGHDRRRRGRACGCARGEAHAQPQPRCQGRHRQRCRNNQDPSSHNVPFHFPCLTGWATLPRTILREQPLAGGVSSRGLSTGLPTRLLSWEP